MSKDGQGRNPGGTRPLPAEGWLSLLCADPRPVLLASADKQAVFLARVALLDEPEASLEMLRREIVADPAVADLANAMQPWREGLRFGGHQSPVYPPALLRLLHQLGVRSGDFSAVDACLDAMDAHQADDGRFLAPGKTGAPWTSLPCDHHAILETLLLYGRGDSPGVADGLRRVGETFAATPQGQAWLCLPDPVAKWRGPGRKADACLQVTVEALRLFALAGPERRPEGLEAAAQTLIDAWRNRARGKPYMFGHGKRFVAGKWPPTWYDASAMLEAIAPWEAVWSAPRNRAPVAEIASALASNFDADGLVTPRSCHRGFEAFAYGQKKSPSHWATARLCAVLRPFSTLFA